MKKGVAARRQRTRESIVVAATERFLSSGFLGTNMDGIAETAGVSKQTVYAHFQTKEELFLAIVGGLTSKASDEHERRLTDSVGAEPIDAFLLTFAQELLSIVMTPKLMQLRRLVIGEADRFPELGKLLYESGPGRSIDGLTRVFVQYQKSGRMIAGDARLAASFFNWLVMGGPTTRVMLLGNRAIPSKAELAKHAGEAVRVFMRAYGTLPARRPKSQGRPTSPRS